jgi:hypothetical protein
MYIINEKTDIFFFIDPIVTRRSCHHRPPPLLLEDRTMSNLYSYFQRIGDKKMPATTATVSQPMPNTDKAKIVRAKMDMSDVFSSDSPKSEKRKQIDETTSSAKSTIDPLLVVVMSRTTI